MMSLLPLYDADIHVINIERQLRDKVEEQLSKLSEKLGLPPVRSQDVTPAASPANNDSRDDGRRDTNGGADRHGDGN